MSSSILVLCLLAGTSWAFVPDGPDFRGIPSIGYPKNGFYLTRNAFAPSSDTAQQVVEKFLARMTRSLESKDVAVISGLFQPGFVFKGCRITGDKKEIIGQLSQLPAGTKFTFTLKSVLDTGSSIKFNVEASGFVSASAEVTFVLNKVDQQLETGEATSCSRGFLGFFQPEDSNAIVKRFLESTKSVIASRSPVLIGSLLDEKFAFKMCDPYSKNQVVEKITSLPLGAPINFELVNSKWIDQGRIEYTAVVYYPWTDRFEAIFVYHPQRNVLISGRFNGCDSKSFSVFY
ncbi:hypothetical protein B9Z55_026397 [Caenorhabditis nigoni]|uniref:NTF2-like domain-containing protein n=1 Tax=Caenorhabditis nigoni TaxID=1611254 RepID=A0A2G5T2K9_9PELO|nr:hypothetical protein B9Z55_026392 [Caenorhabditis nigoni]PIC21634.1 hypothetical protein B9Z55_026397 [Caenorhabditis nigoni]